MTPGHAASVNSPAKPFEITFDRAFEEVVTQCASQPRPGAWIGPEFIAAYTAFHEAVMRTALSAGKTVAWSEVFTASP